MPLCPYMTVNRNTEGTVLPCWRDLRVEGSGRTSSDAVESAHDAHPSTERPIWNGYGMWQVAFRVRPVVMCIVDMGKLRDEREKGSNGEYSLITIEINSGAVIYFIFERVRADPSLYIFSIFDSFPP